YLRSVTFGVAVELPTGFTVTVYSGEKETTDDQPCVIELKQVREPLVIRSHRIGDEIRTGGGNKSVASLLAEQRVARRQRNLVPVVCDRDGIVAVLADRFGSGCDVVARRPSSGGMKCILMICGVSRDG
ncbi:MAG: tRNA lysidine(34) synthetase TilS, partial [Spirochaetia bacterium]